MATFGYTDTSYNSIYMYLVGTCYLRGSYATVGAIGGTADSITIKIYTTDTDMLMSCALYNYVDHTTDYAGTLIKETNTVNVLSTDDGKEIVFTFSDPKPTLVAGTNYYLCVRVQQDPGGKTIKIYGFNGVAETDSFVKSATTPLTFVSPLTGEADIGHRSYIYCTYTEAGGAALTLALGDSIGLSEALKFDVQMKLGDTQALSEALTTQSTFNLALADTETLSESLASGLLMTFNLALADTIALEEAIDVELTVAIRKKLANVMVRKIGWPTPINIGTGA